MTALAIVLLLLSTHFVEDRDEHVKGRPLARVFIHCYLDELTDVRGEAWLKGDSQALSCNLYNTSYKS